MGVGVFWYVCVVIFVVVVKTHLVFLFCFVFYLTWGKMYVVISVTVKPFDWLSMVQTLMLHQATNIKPRLMLVQSPISRQL